MSIQRPEFYPLKNSIRLFSSLVLTVLILACSPVEKPYTGLARSTPEAEGVYSSKIQTFMDSVEKSKNEIHSLVILRHGKVVAEGWWNPYRSDLKHTLYSTSKSFTSTAAGFAVSENKLSVEDKVISFFPDQLPDSISPYLQQMRVKDLLSMSAGQEPDPTWQVVTNDSTWIRSFLALPIQHEPGTVFLYNTLATYMVSAIVQKVTGQKVIDYLTPRLFEPLGITGADWEVDPQGRNVGGWGLRVKTEDMAKLGQLYLQKGKWNGKQILPEAWIAEATTATMKDSSPGLTAEQKATSDWAQGYGYQFWRCRHNAFRADGAYGQYIIALPEQDAVIAITSETMDMQDELNLVWDYLLPAFANEALPADDAAYQSLQRKLATLQLPVPAANDSPVEAILNGKTFAFADNEQGYEEMGFQFASGNCTLQLKMKGQPYTLSFGSGTWKTGETTRSTPTLIPAKAAFVGLPNPTVAGAYHWYDPATLSLTLRFIESPHQERITCHFDKNKATVRITSSQNPQQILQLEGEGR